MSRVRVVDVVRARSPQGVCLRRERRPGCRVTAEFPRLSHCGERPGAEKSTNTSDPETTSQEKTQMRNGTIQFGRHFNFHSSN